MPIRLGRVRSVITIASTTTSSESTNPPPPLAPLRPSNDVADTEGHYAMGPLLDPTPAFTSRARTATTMSDMEGAVRALLGVVEAQHIALGQAHHLAGVLLMGYAHHNLPTTWDPSQPHLQACVAVDDRAATAATQDTISSLQARFPHLPSTALQPCPDPAVRSMSVPELVGGWFTTYDAGSHDNSKSLADWDEYKTSIYGDGWTHPVTPLPCANQHCP